MDVRFSADKQRKAYEDETALRALQFHALTGQRKGQYPVDLGPAYRLILTFQDRAMPVVQVEEVSKHYDD